MSFIHSLIATSYYPISISNRFFRFIRIMHNDRLRVIHYHDVSPQMMDPFEKQIHWLSRHWNFISPDQFAAMIKGEEPIRGPNLLLTFDDGYLSCRKIAERILNPLEIKALFFVSTAFINLNQNEDYQSFIKNNIFPEAVIETVPNHCYCRNLSWNDLRWLLKTGHSIGGHTHTHACLSKINNIEEMKNEIVKSADILENKLGIEINHFSFPFGTLASFNQQALEIARKRFNFIYTGFRGDNAINPPPWAIRRDCLNPNNSLNLIGSLLEGCTDCYYSKYLSQYESWNNS